MWRPELNALIDQGFGRTPVVMLFPWLLAVIALVYHHPNLTTKPCEDRSTARNIEPVPGLSMFFLAKKGVVSM